MSLSDRSRRISFCRGLFLVTAGLAACTPLPDREPLPDWSEGLEPGGTDDPGDTGDTDAPQPVPEAMGIRIPGYVSWRSRIAKTGTDEACEIIPDGTAEGFVDAECTLDIPELNLWGNGLDFELLIPYGVCDYVAYSHYMYERWEVGTGPTEVVITYDAAGRIESEVNAKGGEPYCEYDYGIAIPDAPNCCVGSYTVTEIQADGHETTSPPKLWGGNPAECHDGAAYIDPEAQFDEYGWPKGRIVWLDGAAWSKAFHWDELSAQFATNVPLANYYDPADHDGTMPAGLTSEDAQPHYLFQCYDQASELLGELRLVVREWNEVSEYDADDGDPETSGEEPVTEAPLDDHADWAVATPGSSKWLGPVQ